MSEANFFPLENLEIKESENEEKYPKILTTEQKKEPNDLAELVATKVVNKLMERGYL